MGQPSQDSIAMRLTLSAPCSMELIGTKIKSTIAQTTAIHLPMTTPKTFVIIQPVKLAPSLPAQGIIANRAATACGSRSNGTLTVEHQNGLTIKLQMATTATQGARTTTQVIPTSKIARAGIVGTTARALSLRSRMIQKQRTLKGME